MKFLSTCCGKLTEVQYVWVTKEKFIVRIICKGCGNQCESEMEDEE